MKIEVLRKSLLAVNDQAAQQNRLLLNEHGVVTVNIMGGAGCGKTALLEAVLPRMKESFSVAVLEGDVATTRDAERIAKIGVPVLQLLTDGGCHLTASLVQHALHRLALDDLDLLLIENVGNPICPANFDLGEDYRVSVLSVTEGDDKPAKYPYLFKVANLVVLSKMDLVELTDFHVDRVRSSLHALGHDQSILETSARSGLGIADLCAWMTGHVSRPRNLALA